jgi:hypothetical protein
MPRPLCREDLYEYHYKSILGKLREVHKNCETSEPFNEEWLGSNLDEVGGEFLDDLAKWAGVDEVIAELDD